MPSLTSLHPAHRNGFHPTRQPNVALIGLGAIASGYGTADEAAPYCHVGGLLHSERVRLHAVADMSEAARNAFCNKWGDRVSEVQVFDSSESLLDSGTPDEPLDIMGVCVRGPYHFSVVKQVLAAAPQAGIKAIFLEKPPTCSLKEMDEMVDIARSQNVTLTVSYSRHWAPHVLRLEQLVREGLIGEVHSVIGYCGELVLSYASHTTDLIRQFALARTPGQAVSVMARAHIEASNERQIPLAGYEAEPSLDYLAVEFSNGVMGTQIGARGEAGSFYVEVFGSAGRVRAGMYLKPEAWEADGNAIDLGEMPTDFSVFQVAYEQIAAHLDGGSFPDCTGSSWHEVNEIGFAAIESAVSGQFQRIGPSVFLPNQNRSRKIWANG